MKDNGEKSRMFSLLTHEKARKVIVVCLILGIGLIFLSEILPEKEADKETEETSQQLISTEVYVEELEKKLQKMVQEITGAEASVTLTVESGYKNVLATEDKESVQETEGKTSQSRENSYIVIRNADGSQSTVQILQEEPIVRGVVVLCKNGENVKVQQQVISAVTTVLHISSARVCVLNSNGGGS